MSDWRVIGRVPYTTWANTILRAGGPVDLSEPSAWEAAGEHSALALAMLNIESKYGTAFNRNKRENKNPLNLRPPNGDGYMAFDSYPEAVTAWYDRITSKSYKSGIYANTISLEDLISVYAPASDDNDEAAYVATIRTLWNQWGVQGEPMPTRPTVLLIAGHRSHGDAGNPVEKNMTDDLARAYKSALTAAGYTVTWLQETDGDTDPDDTAGGLDTVSNKARQWCASTPGQKILLDLHFEGTAPSVRGCFAIIPDRTGLSTGAPVPQSNADTWENNAGDRKLGRAIVDNLSRLTGIPLRTGIREPGLMDESQTGVGGQGYRLATFAYTSPHCADTVRLVVEHGAHTNAADRAIITAPGFFAKCGAAAVAAMNAVYGDAPAPNPEYAEPVGWPSKIGQVGVINVGAAKARLITCEVECVKPNGTIPRAYASAKAGQSGPKIKQGAKVTVIATVTVPGDKRPSQWHVLSTLDRVGASGFLPKLPPA